MEGALFDLDGVSGPDAAGLDHPGADAASVLEGARHAPLAQVLDVFARRARAVELEEHLPDAEPLAAKVQEPHAARDDVAAVLARPYIEALLLDLVEVLALDEGDLAHVPVLRPEALSRA